MDSAYVQVSGECVKASWPLPAKLGPRKRWTDAEMDVLREHYPVGGVAACSPLLPGRSERTIYIKAAKLGLRSNKYRAAPTNWTWNVHQDNAIRITYRDDPRRGRVQRLARRLGRPPYVVSLRARQLGLVAPGGHGTAWSQREHDLIVANAAKKPISIALILKRNGFKRTPGAIQARLNTQHIDRTDDDHHTGNGLALLMGVNVHKVASWIEKGWLKAKRLPGERTHYSIHRKDVRRFIVENVGEVDIRRCDKHWLVDLLAWSSPPRWASPTMRRPTNSQAPRQSRSSRSAMRFRSRRCARAWPRSWPTRL